MSALCDTALDIRTMVDDFPITTAQIVGLFMECILYGVHLVTLAQCLRSLLWSDAENSFKRKINWRMLTVALLMGLFATLDVALGLRHNLDAFVYYTGPDGAAAEFANISKRAGGAPYSMVGDGMLIYRCYLVYDRKWYYAAPSFLLWLGGSSCGVLVIAIYATLHTQSFLDASQAQRYVYSGLSLTLAVNVITTSLIVYRIWSVDRQTAHMRVHRASRLKSIVRIIIESAALYTVSVIVFFCTYVANSNANYGATYNVVQMIGISFNLIIIRVDSGKAYEGTTKRGSDSTSAASATSTPMKLPLTTFQAGSGVPSTTAVNPPLEITIQQEFGLGDKDSLGQLELPEKANWSAA
ncbi:hypothetical protein F5I97DRAFT_1931247 [Phlebopus sp. FC_14]|nr:hypothetical protein F5I97DRAFT_1931247 [Phlebopus sp. FC_14]